MTKMMMIHSFFVWCDDSALSAGYGRRRSQDGTISITSLKILEPCKDINMACKRNATVALQSQRLDVVVFTLMMLLLLPSVPKMFTNGFAVQSLPSTSRSISPVILNLRRPGDEEEEGSNIWSDLQAFWNRNVQAWTNPGTPRSVTALSHPANDPTVVTSIPVKSMKSGGLRVFLMLYLLGQQNTPAPKTWRFNSGDDSLEMYYVQNGSPMVALSVTLSDKEICIRRRLTAGSILSPSYLIHETCLLEGLLQEIRDCANDDSIAAANRLLHLLDASSVEDAIASLSFG
jgi:hypothetical protein